MSDKGLGGVVAFAVAAPLVFVCCGGGAGLLAALFAGVGGWLSGLGWVAALVAAFGAFVIFREIRRRRGERCASQIVKQESR